MDVAARVGTAIISADSRQCYKSMDIGTAKPSIAERTAIDHYFVDEFPFTQNITAAGYEALALGYLDKIFTTHNTAVVCGGTGLYIKALCEGLDAMPAIDTKIDEQVNEQYKEKGIAWLQHAVKENDPLFYTQGEIQNPMRLIRALVFKLSTGESITTYRTGIKKARPFKIIKVGLELPREELNLRINKRVDVMMNEGLLDEVKQLHPYKDLKNLQTVGYSELFDYLEGNYSLEEAVLKIKQNTRHYAKRQMTWFKKEKDVIWFNANEHNLAEQILLLK